MRAQPRQERPQRDSLRFPVGGDGETEASEGAGPVSPEGSGLQLPAPVPVPVPVWWTVSSFPRNAH